ncbi:hypothetical protein [Granulicoccus phenolivorans]|uniref:hypothetical protein n=1 Tax=Granulicoccus phenolivorans TaxID=266854 RepID=UPI000412631B|nr:hypothetical protein [Granulicoccus phenolivorans]
MPIVDTCVYDATTGLLRMPDSLAFARARAKADLDTGERATFDRGYVHVVEFRALGHDRRDATGRLNAELDHFLSWARDVPGFHQMQLTRAGGRVLGTQFSATCRVVYAVEEPARAFRRERRTRPNPAEAPYEG